MMTRKPLGRPLGDTEYLLEQWGWWRLDGKGVPTCISPSYALIRDNVGVPKTLDYRITDDVAVLVDHAVARLTARNQLMGDLIWLYYGEKWPALKIGRRNNMGEAKARELIKTGVGWIDAKLENLTQAA